MCRLSKLHNKDKMIENPDIQGSAAENQCEDSNIERKNSVYIGNLTQDLSLHRQALYP